MKSFLNYSKNRILYNLFRFLFIFLLVFLLSKCEVKALSSGEDYSEFAVTKVPLIRLFNLSDELYLYGANNNGSACSVTSYNLECWLGGELPLLTYAIPADDPFTDWGMTIYFQNTLKKGVEYTLNIPFVTTLDAVSNAIMRESNIVSTSNSELISAETTCASMSCNYIWKIKPTSDITNLTVNFQKVSTGIGLSWLNSEVYLFYYPRIVASSGNENFDALEYNQQIIIDQNQTIINQNNQTNNNLEDIKEQNKEAEETRKGIWETLKSIPSMIGDALKSLFIPSDDFFESFINDFMGTLKDKLGFLVYPFELFGDVINRFLDIPNGDGIIHIPQINDPIYGHELIKEQDFNIGQVFKTGKIGELHDIYLTFIDVSIIIMLVNLAIRKFNQTIGGGGVQ